MAKKQIAANQRQLEQAFSIFSEASQQLSAVYSELQLQVERLTRELAAANGELRRQLLEKEALSQRLSLLLTALPGGVVVLDEEEKVAAANPAAMKIMDEPLLGLAWQEIAAERLLPTGTRAEWETRAKDEASPRRVSIVSSKLDSAGGKILLVHDITEAYTMQQQLQRNQRLSAMGEMAAGLAHQLRTPLATALLYTAHLGNPDLPREERADFAEKALARLHHLEQLIKDMLLFVKGETVEWETVPVSALLAELQQVIEPQMAQLGLRFVVTDESGGAALTGCRKALVGALLNLLENAMQACTSGGSVKLASRITSNTVILAVSDSGRGIDAELHERLFEPFFSTRSDGNGLGLAIVRGVVQSHGGTVRVASTPGSGSEFVLQLPRKMDMPQYLSSAKASAGRGRSREYRAAAQEMRKLA